MSAPIIDKPPIVDRDFAEKFLTSVDRPLEYGVYYLFHDWWEGATTEAIDAYLAAIHAIPGATAFLKERFLAPQITIESLKQYPAGTLGHAYREFVEENNLIETFGSNYQSYHQELKESGKLDRMPEDLAYMRLRGTQVHDFLHVLTGYGATVPGELALAAFTLAQVKFSYQSTRLAVTMAHTAFVAPQGIDMTMNAFVDGWTYGKESRVLYFDRWEERLGEQLSDLQSEMNLRQVSKAA